MHEGEWISMLVTPADCGMCHEREVAEFSSSHHARGGEILTSLDNVLAEKAAGLPDEIVDAVNGCWPCHGSIVDVVRDEEGAILREGGPAGKPRLDPDT